MSRHVARAEYALCDYEDDDGRRCREFVAPPRRCDPMGPGAVFAGYLDVTEAARAAEWLTTADEGDWCAAHKGLVLAARGRAAIDRAEREITNAEAEGLRPVETVALAGGAL